MMGHYMQVWTWRPERDMKGWNLGGRPDRLSENESDHLIYDYEMADISVVLEFCLSLRE